MRVRDGKRLRKVYQSNLPTFSGSVDISCHQVYELKKQYTGGEFKNPTEPIVVRLLSNYLMLNDSGENDGIKLFWGPVYRGEAGNNQEIDISIEYNGNVMFGISVKSKFGGGYLEKADLSLHLLKEYRSSIKRFEERGSVSDVLQDMARIQNIKENLGEFNSITILYSKPMKKDWTEIFVNRFSHQYIFLEDNPDNFFEELEEKLPGLKSFKKLAQGGYAYKPTVTLTGKGRARKGSQLHLQNLVNNHQKELNNLILTRSPSLLTFVNKGLRIHWKSPLRKNDFREYRNEFIELIDEWHDKRQQLDAYWAKKGPQWDGIAVVEGKNGDKGLLLVEAKAHLNEMKSKIQASDKSAIRIKETISEVMNYVGSTAKEDIWLNQYYQLSNRLAYLYLLNKKLGIPTWLVLVNFVEDSTHISTSLSSWMNYNQEVYSRMGLSWTSDLLKQVISIYPMEHMNM